MKPAIACLLVLVLAAFVSVTVEPKALLIVLPPFLLALVAIAFIGRKKRNG